MYQGHEERGELDGPYTDPPILISHFFRTLRAYQAAILIAIVTVGVAASILAIVAYLFSGSQRMVTVPFRLEFEGATEGRYPNGLRFSTSDITRTPTLLDVYRTNGIERYSRFDDFARSLFILEANPAYERLAADYASRLADPKLTPLDRERLEREFEAKREGLNKNEYSINYLSSSSPLPDPVARKVLADVLQAWARYAVSEQRILQYRVPVLSPNVVAEVSANAPNDLIAAALLRSKLFSVLINIDSLRQLPGADLVRTKRESASLQEIHMRTEELIRFTLEPLITSAVRSATGRELAETATFFESQLSYDQRQLAASEERISALRDALTSYEGRGRSANDQQPTTTSAERHTPSAEGPPVVPQLSESFIDRVVDLVSQSKDVQYRQELVREMRAHSLESVPITAAVAYDKQMLDDLRRARASQGQDDRVLKQRLAAARAEAQELLRQINEIFLTVSRNLNPATELYRMTAPPTSRIIRRVSAPRLALYVMAAVLVSIPLILLAVIIANRVKEEEAAERSAADQASERVVATR